MKKKLLFVLFIAFTTIIVRSQVNIELYEQFNGRYDFTFVGNTLNLQENGLNIPCEILTSSSASLNLTAGDEVIAAYLYWAGSGEGDFEITLNGQAVAAERDFALIYPNPDRAFFSAFANITSIVQATGNGTYTVADFDLTAIINSADNTYCPNGTNFGGWAMVVVYENINLPLNQLNLYDGLQHVPNNPQINLTLPSLNVVDNIGAKIGFLAWEGDSQIAVNESLRINGNVLSNPPLNPPTNAFNGTNSFTGASNLYNMDLDVYNIQNFITIGDSSAEIQLTSGQDLVLVNAIMTKLNSQLPDATIVVSDIAHTCNSRVVDVTYTVSNTNSTDVLPAGTPIAIYANGDLLATTVTTNELPIGGSETATITLTIPASSPIDYELIFVVDDQGNGLGGIVTETNEANNTYLINDSLWVFPIINPLDITVCETFSGSGNGIFDFSGYEESLKTHDTDTVTFHTTQLAAENDEPGINNPESFTSTGQEIYVRIEDENGCFTTASFTLTAEICTDGTIVINNFTTACNSRELTVTYTVNNIGDIPLPAGTSIAIYVNNTLVAVTSTTGDIAVGTNTSSTITITIPLSVPQSFDLIFVVDDDGTGTGSVPETSETNNTFTLPVTLWMSPPTPQPDDITVCETANGSNVGLFDFSGYETTLQNNPTDIVTFHLTQNGALNGDPGITNPDSFTSTVNPQTIYVRVEDTNGCFSVGSFQLIAVDCLFPDGTVLIDNMVQACDSRVLDVDYTVNNFNSFDILPAGTQVAIYANTTLLQVITLPADLAVGDSFSSSVSLTIPAGIPLNFNLIFVVDDNGTGTGAVVESDETNNAFTLPVTLWLSPILQQPADITACETFNGSGEGAFDFSGYITSLKNNPTDVVTFHNSQDEANIGTPNITDPAAYISAGNEQIFVRVEDEHGCFDTGSFNLIIIDCYFPDGTVVIDDVYKQCNSRIIHVHYTVNNFNATDVLPAGTPVSIYVNGQLMQVTATLATLQIDESEDNFIELTIPIGIPLDFDLTFVVDDTGNGTGVVIELEESNNSFTLPTSLVLSPVLQQPEDIEGCDEGLETATFDFSDYTQLLQNYPNETVTFYTTQQNADQDLDRIYNTTSFIISQNPQRIFVRLENGTCHTTASFLLYAKKCKPTPYNYVTPNGDGINDTFFVKGLRNVFLNFKMTIYNRWGNLVWTGDHSQADWNGIATVEKVGPEGNTVPTGTYYFVLELNDTDYPEPIVGWVYVTK